MCYNECMFIDKFLNYLLANIVVVIVTIVLSLLIFKKIKCLRIPILGIVSIYTCLFSLYLSYSYNPELFNLNVILSVKKILQYTLNAVIVVNDYCLSFLNGGIVYALISFLISLSIVFTIKLIIIIKLVIKKCRRICSLSKTDSFTKFNFANINFNKESLFALRC